MSITINGSTGVSGVDGSSTTPALQGTDTNTGLFYGTDIVGISTGGSERVRVDASGNVGIGAISPTAKLQIGSLSGSNATYVGDIQINAQPTSLAQVGGLEFKTSTFGSGYGWKISSIDSSGVHLVFGTRQNSATWTEAMRIDSSGNVLVNKTSQSNTGRLEIDYSRSTHAGSNYNETSSLSSCTHIAFQRGGTAVGSIQSANNSSTSYNTSSDYRLKENIVPMTGALNKVALLKPVTYIWKTDGSNSQGFIAHELQEIVPECVTGEKDAVDAEGKPVYQGVDTSFLVATLTAAIQEQQTIINDLKARVTALEASNV